MGELINLNNSQMIKIEEDREFKHKNRERLCYCCDILQDTKEKINIYRLEGRQYGSLFDGVNADIQLCDNCKIKFKQAWLDEIPKIVDKYCEEYQFEGELLEIIDSLPIENQEYILNNPNNLTYNDEYPRNIWLFYAIKNMEGGDIISV